MCVYYSLLCLNSDGEMLVAFLKYLPKKLWLEKFILSAISFTEYDVLRRSDFISINTKLVIQ